MPQNMDSTPKRDQAPKQGQWRVHPIWSTVGVILTATGLADLVIGYYPDPKIPVTGVSILGGVVCVAVILWNPLIAAWHSGYAGFRSVISVYVGPYPADKAGFRGLLFLAGITLLALGKYLTDTSKSIIPVLVGLFFLLSGFVLLCLRTSSLLNKKR